MLRETSPVSEKLPPIPASTRGRDERGITEEIPVVIAKIKKEIRYSSIDNFGISQDLCLLL